MEVQNYYASCFTNTPKTFCVWLPRILQNQFVFYEINKYHKLIVQKRSLLSTLQTPGRWPPDHLLLTPSNFILQPYIFLSIVFTLLCLDFFFDISYYEEKEDAAHLETTDISSYTLVNLLMLHNHQFKKGEVSILLLHLFKSSHSWSIQ